MRHEGNPYLPGTPEQQSILQTPTKKGSKEKVINTVSPGSTPSPSTNSLLAPLTQYMSPSRQLEEANKQDKFTDMEQWSCVDVLLVRKLIQRAKFAFKMRSVSSSSSDEQDEEEE